MDGLEEIVSSRSLKNVEARLSVHRFVKDFLDGYNKDTAKPAHSEYRDKIWVYWAQGKDKMPPIVRACSQQLYLFHDDKDIIFLNDDNISDFVNIPDYLYEKLRENKTHFSDVLRVALLTEHGGIWIDATCYISNSVVPIYDETMKTGFFAFSFIGGQEFLLSSWFMASRVNEIIPGMLRDALYYYWQERDELEHYFLLHYIFEALYNLDAGFRTSWDSRFILGREIPHVLQSRLFHEFDIDWWNDIMGMSLVHKLTYKYPDREYKGTYLAHILGEIGDKQELQGSGAEEILSDLNILVSTDRNYIPLTKTLLHSIFDNNRDCKVGIHVLHSALDEDDLSVLDKTIKSYGGELFSYKIAESRDTDTIVKKTRLPKEAYYRLLCMDCLPNSLDRVLYLDCDIIVNGSLKVLYNTDLTGYMFAAADDYVEVIGKSSEPTTQQRAVIDQYIPKDCLYVNSGVLLMNLELLRKAVTTDEIISMIEEFGDLLVWHDQDFINYVFYEHILHVDYRLYNYFPVYYFWGEVSKGKPVIIHFAGVFKPWKDNYFERCEPFVEAYQNTTRRFVEQAKELYEKYAAMD